MALISTNDSHLKYLVTYHYENKIRFGNKEDGGYVCADLPDYDCYLSIGVGGDESFSTDLIEYFEMTKENSFAFDGTIGELPGNFSQNMTFINKNIGTENTDNTDTLDSYFNNYNNIFMKMDIEGYEYEYILSLPVDNLKKIKQLVMEIHGINDNGLLGFKEWPKYVAEYSMEESFIKKVEFFKKISETHYLIHVHANNGGAFTIINNNRVSNVIEVCYVRKTEFADVPPFNTIPFPIENLDYDNYPFYARPDLPPCPPLDFIPFCFPQP